MMKALLIFPIFFALFSTVYSVGHIYHWDYTADYTNTGYITSFSFGFSLEHAISNSDYIKMVFPFVLHSSAIVSDSLSVYLKLVGSTGCTPLQTTSTLVFLSSSGSTTYFIQLLDEKGNVNKPLAANTWYILKFQFKNALTIAQGNYAPVQMYTVSDRTTISLIYDYNIAFANIEITSAPSINTLKFTTTIASGIKSDIDAIYDVVFDILPSKTINQARIFVLMQKNDWVFNGDSCISIDQNVTTTLTNGTIVTQLIKKLNSTDFTCIIGSLLYF